MNIANLWSNLKKHTKGDVERFLENYRRTKNDPINEFMHEKVKELKERENKKSVLIIDNLDRLDPENIFKVLNSFNVFLGMDEEDTEINKNFLGFDKVIFVGDIRNIKSILHHKYGDKADFEGYFDRFFSYEPFDYNELLKEFSHHIAMSLASHLESLGFKQSFTYGEIEKVLSDESYGYSITFRKLAKVYANRKLFLEKVHANLERVKELEHYIRDKLMERSGLKDKLILNMHISEAEFQRQLFKEKMSLGNIQIYTPILNFFQFLGPDKNKLKMFIEKRFHDIQILKNAFEKIFLIEESGHFIW